MNFSIKLCTLKQGHKPTKSHFDLNKALIILEDDQFLYCHSCIHTRAKCILSYVLCQQNTRNSKDKDTSSRPTTNILLLPQNELFRRMTDFYILPFLHFECEVHLQFALCTPKKFDIKGNYEV